MLTHRQSALQVVALRPAAPGLAGRREMEAIAPFFHAFAEAIGVGRILPQMGEFAVLADIDEVFCSLGGVN
ncbi:hypothetical protein GFM44_14380 [Rhizobium leguminosarum bv. viciae]|nr:hypothetical protein [Rhizobium leguminosarum bv. viciae]